MKFERFTNIPGGEHDWLIQIGDVDGRKSFRILLRYFTKCGFRLTINLCSDGLIKFFGFREKVFGV